MINDYMILGVKAIGLIVGFLIIKYLKKKLDRYIRKLFSITKTNIDDIIYENVKDLIWYIVIILYFNASLFYLFPKIFTLLNLDVIFRALYIIIATFAIIKVLDIFESYFSERPEVLKVKDIKLFKTAINIIGNISKIVISFISFLIILSLFNINITPIIASAGLVGIAVGFALKDIIENVLSGILIFLDPPFKVGDAVQIGNFSGSVIEIGLRQTKIRTWDGNIVVIPNSDIIKTKLINYHMPSEIVRVTLKIGVSYDIDPEYVKKVIIEEVLNKVDTILKDPKPQVLFLEFGDFSLNFEIRFWVNIKDKMSTIDRVNTLIWKVFKEKGIEIPYPIRTIYLRNEKN